MANRKKHLRRQARRQSGGGSIPSAPGKVIHQTNLPADGPASTLPKKSVGTGKSENFTQLEPTETALVWRELRHGLLTMMIVVGLFVVIGLLFAFTTLDEKIYSLLQLTS